MRTSRWRVFLTDDKYLSHITVEAKYLDIKDGVLIFHDSYEEGSWRLCHVVTVIAERRWSRVRPLEEDED